MILETQKAEIDLSAVIQASGVELQRQGARARGRCPFHDDRNPSLSVYTDGRGHQRFHCFGCHADGDVIDFVRQKYSLSFKEALDHLGIRLGPLSAKQKADIARRKKEREIVSHFRQWVYAAIEELGLYIRATRLAMSGWKTLQDFEENCEILGPLAKWESYLDLLINGSDKEKAELFVAWRRGDACF